MTWWWDPTYIIVFPALFLTIWAQYKVKSSFTKYSKYKSVNGKPAFLVVKEILSSHGLGNVKIGRVFGKLRDHYNPVSMTLRLSNEVYDSTSIAAIGIAAHEAGHAIQHAQGYLALKIRNSFIPAVKLTSWTAIPLFFLGFSLQNKILIHLGIFFFAGVVLFQLVTLPVELDASKRALKILKNGYFNKTEYLGVRRILFSAAMTYLSAALMSSFQLVYLLIKSGILRRRND